MKRLALFAACVVLAACSPNPAAMPDGRKDSPEMAGQGSTMSMAPTASDSEATRAYKTSMSTMMDTMPAFVGDADVDFMK